VHHIIEGAGTLVTGGTIVRAAGAAAGLELRFEQVK
jgi:hypothetical protein